MADDELDENLIEELRKMKKKRAIIKGNVTRFQKVVEEARNSGVINQLSVRLPRFELLLSEFEAIQEQIEDLDGVDEDREERTNFENVYFSLLSQAKEILPRSPSQMSAGSSHNPSDSILNQRNPTHNSPTIRLPQVDIPKFSGNYEDWRSFIDIFDSMVHANVAISDAQRLLYLSDALQGEAREVIKFLNITAENYIVARRLLFERYDKKQFIISAHIKALFDLSSMSRESSSELRKLISIAKQHLRSIQALELPIDQWDPIIIVLLKRKLDPGTCRQWELEQKEPNVLPKLKDFYEFLEQRCFALEATSDGSDKYKKTTRIVAHVGTTESSKVLSCKLCSKAHNLYHCDKFLKLSHDERVEAIQSAGVCFNCLRNGHAVRSCTSMICKKCNAKHHTLIHPEKRSTVQHTDEKKEEKPAATSNNLVTMTVHSDTAEVLLATAQILVKNSQGEWLPCRALLDSASQSNFVTISLAKRLQCEFIPTKMSINCISNTSTSTSEMVKLNIKSRVGNYQRALKCLVLPEITIQLPSTQIDIKRWNLPDVTLADPSFAEPNSVDMLIGAELYFELLKCEQIRLGPQSPILQESVFGWIVAGRVQESSSHQTFCHFSTQNLSDQIEKFWVMEECKKIQHLTPEERDCEESFQKTHSREPSGRFVVKLPLKRDASCLGDSSRTAMRRYESVKRKMALDTDFETQYRAFMMEYRELRHMTEVKTTQTQVNFIPHHAVIRESSSTTRLRVVFDGSARTSSGTSLNDILMVGPKTQSDLFGILIRFRQYAFVICADIEKMYRQILIASSDRHLQQIYWQETPQEEVKVFQLNTITYGLASSPYLACRCLKQLALEHEIEFPEASRAVADDFYVDDLLTGGTTIQEVSQLKRDITTIMERGQFNLRKWKSNSEILLGRKEQHIQTNLPTENSQASKTLGLCWDSESDIILYSVIDEETGVTKRQVLSQIAKLFDPLGLLAPIILNAKIIMQRLWQLKSDWDEILPHQLQKDWTTFKEEMKVIADLRIPRCVQLPESETFQIHAFADASEKGYGAVIYIRSSMKNNVRIRVLCAKSRVAPLKNVSLPRLELCAALLLARLCQSIQESLRIKPERIFYWSDSTITLYWINTEPHKLKTFIANRVAEIQTLTSPRDWHHVSTQEPATYSYENISDNRLSRYQFLQKLKNHFWQRWYREYLQILQTRKRWKVEHPNVEVGAMVVIIEDNLPPLQWSLGRIIAVHPGTDHVVRVVSVRVRNDKVFKRPVKKLCVLPINE